MRDSDSRTVCSSFYTLQPTMHTRQVKLKFEHSVPEWGTRRHLSAPDRNPPNPLSCDSLTIAYKSLGGTNVSSRLHQWFNCMLDLSA